MLNIMSMKVKTEEGELAIRIIGLPKQPGKKD